MFSRRFWQQRIEDAWRRRSVVWLMGVRRVGKTVLSRSLPDAEYFDCERPRVRRLMVDPESFLEDLTDRTVVLDEIHRLDRPSELLKIAADHYPTTRILATGSSSLGASAHFKDTLSGRKEEVWLTPMIAADLEDFGNSGLEHRLLRGGLPPFFLADELPEAHYQEWMDAFWAKDILELFRLERRRSFLRFVELLLVQSGGIFEATRFARSCEVSRTTITNYLAVLEATFVMHVVRPFAQRPAAEIVAAPRVFGFDTGFVSYYRGWKELRFEDIGILWEHLVLNELHARLPAGMKIRYWRNKQGAELDFVVPGRGTAPTAIECKRSADEFDPRGLKAFRRHYPEGVNLVVATDIDRPFTRRNEDLSVRFTGLKHLTDEIGA
jgi:predicted AAA+ superfamily ATPase